MAGGYSKSCCQCRDNKFFNILDFLNLLGKIWSTKSTGIFQRIFVICRECRSSLLLCISDVARLNNHLRVLPKS
jgi:hypothetical protein